MLGLILGALAIGTFCSACGNSNAEESIISSSCYKNKYDSLKQENNHLKKENHYIKITFQNHMTLLADYDKVNRYAKKKGFSNSVEFFYYLGEKHDERFYHFARFLNKVKHVRNDVAHNGTVYNINQNFIKKLSACVEICNMFERLPIGKRLYLN